jgi:hypothetical protein
MSNTESIGQIETIAQFFKRLKQKKADARRKRKTFKHKQDTITLGAVTPIILNPTLGSALNKDEVKELFLRRGREKRRAKQSKLMTDMGAGEIPQKVGLTEVHQQRLDMCSEAMREMNALVQPYHRQKARRVLGIIKRIRAENSHG